jgi:hypothetical protein
MRGLRRRNGKHAMIDDRCRPFFSTREVAFYCLLWMLNRWHEMGSLSGPDLDHVRILYEVAELTPRMREMFGFPV